MNPMKMKRYIRLSSITMVFLILMVLCSCSFNKKDSENKAGNENNLKSDQVAEQEKIYASTDSLPDRSYLVDSLIIDINNDEINEMISLYVDAERDGKRILWEDGHQWWLTVRLDSGTFVLFNKFIPFGAARFWVIEEDNYHIVLLSDSPHSLEMVSYQMLQEEDAFVRNTALNLHGNVRYRTPDKLFE